MDSGRGGSAGMGLDLKRAGVRVWNSCTFTTNGLKGVVLP